MTMATGRAIAPTQRQVLMQGPLGAILVLPGADTSGRLCVVEHPLAPRTLGSPMHTHRDEDEYSIVIEGVVGARIGDQVVEAGPGGVLVKPRGVPHAFWNPTDEPARLLEIISPSGFENYFAEIGEILAQTPPDLEALGAAAARYALDLDVASVPVLVAAHNLTGSSLDSGADR
jgi:mannose-6-phosphate isomerase-like protein (cupin superfamily)